MAAGAGPTLTGIKSDEERMYVESRIQTILLTRIANLLALIAGPAAYVEPNGWTPEDLSAEVDAWRNDSNLLPY